MTRLLERFPDSRTSPARRLLIYLARYRRAFALGFVCAALATSIQLASPWVLKRAIDDLQAGATMDKVRVWAALLLVCAATAGVFRFLMRRIIIGASRDFEYDLRNDFFAQLLRLDPEYFQRNRTGDLMSRATNDLAAVRMLIGPAVMYTATTGLTFLVATSLMVSIHPRLASIALLPLPFVSVVVRYFGSAIHRRFERIQQQLAEVNVVTQESLAGVRVVRAYRQEPFEIARFRSANEEYLRGNRTLIALQGTYFPTMGLLMGIGAMFVLWLGGRDVIAGRMSVGDLVAFNTYLMMLAWPMIAFGWVTNLVQRGTASWKRMLEVMDATPAIADPPGKDSEIRPGLIFRETDKIRPGRISGVVSGGVEFRDVTFAYGGRTVLHDVSATMPAGTTTAIVGATGSGKSTLLRLIPRLAEPTRGTVLVNGVDVSRLPFDVLRRSIGVVPQEPFLFSTTIGENIAYGVGTGKASPEAIARAGALARLDKDLERFPAGYETLVGERGLTLSGGQKQRVAIARALIIDPAVLILDDAFSAVDTHTEEEILTGLSGTMRERTTILVSHRISTVRHADQILVMSEGRIVERGTHGALVARGGLYAALDRRQQLEEELEAS